MSTSLPSVNPHRAVSDCAFLSTRSWRLRESLRNPLFFLSYYMPEQFSKPFSRFHRELASVFLSAAKSHSTVRANIIAPRSVAKSTLFSVGLPIFVSVFPEFCQKHLIVLISDTFGQSVSNIDSVRKELEDNERLREDFGDLKTDYWSTERIVARGRMGLLDDLAEIGVLTPKGWSEDFEAQEGAITPRLIAKSERWEGTLITAIGTSMKIRGRHFRQHRPDLIILDDPQNDDQVRSPVIREKDYKWFKEAVLPAGSVDGFSVVALGTSLHPDCLVESLCSKDIRFRTHRYQFVESWPERKDLWEKCRRLFIDLSRGEERFENARRFYVKHRKAMERGFRLLQHWASDISEEWSYFDTMVLFWTDEISFLKERQCDPQAASSRLWSWEADFTFFANADWPRAKYGRVILAVDPAEATPAAKQKKGHGDYTAISVHGVTEDGTRHVMEVFASLEGAEASVEHFLDMYARWSANAAFIESNTYQGLAPLIKKEAKDKGMAVNIYAVKNTMNKEARISYMKSDIVNGHIRFADDLPPECKEQFNGFRAGGEHDDVPDAIELGDRMLCTNTDVTFKGDYSLYVRADRDAAPNPKRGTAAPACEKDYPYSGKNLSSERLSRYATFCQMHRGCRGCPIAKYLNWATPVAEQFIPIKEAK